MSLDADAVKQTFDHGDVYYQLSDAEGNVEATLHARAWNVELFRRNITRRYAEDEKDPKGVTFITKEAYRQIIWPKKSKPKGGKRDK